MVNVIVHDIHHGGKNYTYYIDRQHRTAATWHTLQTWFVSGTLYNCKYLQWRWRKKTLVVRIFVQHCSISESTLQNALWFHKMCVHYDSVSISRPKPQMTVWLMNRKNKSIWDKRLWSHRGTVGYSELWLISVAVWQGGGGPAFRSLCPTTETFHSKNPMGSCAVVPCEGKLILLRGTELSAMFRLIRDVRKLRTPLLTFWTSNKWRPVQSGTHLRLRQGLHVFSASFARREATTAHGVKAAPFLLSIQ
jgi:hypothetical protein